MQLKILKDGNRTTYILTRDGESIPLVSVEKDIKVEKNSHRKRGNRIRSHRSAEARSETVLWSLFRLLRSYGLSN